MHDLAVEDTKENRKYENVHEVIDNFKYKGGDNKCEHVLLASQRIKNAVLDCGCTKTVAGSPTVKGLLDLLTDDERKSIVRKRDKRSSDSETGSDTPQERKYSSPSV